MLWESSNDLFGHRKGFLSAGVTSGVRPGCHRHLRGRFRRPEWAAAFTGRTRAEDGGSKSTQSCPAADIQQNKTKQNCSVCLDGTGSLSPVRTGQGTLEKLFRSQSCCMVFPSVVSASHLKLNIGLHFNCCLVLWIGFFEKVQVQFLVTC